MMNGCRQTLLVRLELLEFSSEKIVFDTRVTSVQKQEMRDVVRLNLFLQVFQDLVSLVSNLVQPS